MAKKIIAVDLDDVLAHENEAMREFINETYGLELTAEDYNIEAPYWGYWEHVWGVDEEEGNKRLQTFLSSGIKAKLRVLDGAIEVITKLKKHYELVIVTSRNDQLMDTTHEWLERHFPSTFRSVEFVHVWSGDQKASKAVICKEVGATYLIDDNLEHCTLAAEAGIQALLFGDYGWNRKVALPKNIQRVVTWREVEEYFDERSRR